MLQERLDGMVSGLDETVLLGPVRARIDQHLRQEQAEHWQRLQDELTGPRYLALLDDLADWVARPPWTRAASKPAERVARFVRHAERTVSRRLRRANASDDIHQLHATRRAAKRARNAAEAAEPVIAFGILHEREQQRACDARNKARRTARKYS